MKKRILLSCTALCSVVFGALAQRSYTFNAAALNVDGLPDRNQKIERKKSHYIKKHRMI